ncbi:hypothetical protein LXL04_030432 [Taraxacum kok-saghyz]
MATQLTHSHFFLPSYKLLFAATHEPCVFSFGARHRCYLLATDCASSPSESRFAASFSIACVSLVRVAGRKPTTTNADLCNDLREFISDAGFLTDMQDLANLLRRIGYKLIKELLAASQEVKVTDSDAEETLTNNQDKTSTEEDESTGLDENETKLTEDVILIRVSSKLTVPLNHHYRKNSVNSPNRTILSTTQLRDISSNDQQLKNPEPTNTVKEDEAEINRIKVMLHHKELELSQLKEQIEKNKNTLSELQAKAETEINKAQKLVLDKDVELLAVEESLSGLKQEETSLGEEETIGDLEVYHQGWIPCEAQGLMI